MKYKKIFRDAMAEKNITIDDICSHFGKDKDKIENWLCGISQPRTINDRVAFCEYFGIKYEAGLFTYDEGTKPIKDGYISLLVNTYIPEKYTDIISIVQKDPEVDFTDFVEFLKEFEYFDSKNQTYDILHWCYSHVSWANYIRIVACALKIDENFSNLIYGEGVG